MKGGGACDRFFGDARDEEALDIERGGELLEHPANESRIGLRGREEIGETQRARDLCERMLGYASSLDLYAEEIDAHTGRHLGNFPQAFTHLALINAVMHVISADKRLAAAQQPLDARRDEP